MKICPLISSKQLVKNTGRYSIQSAFETQWQECVGSMCAAWRKIGPGIGRCAYLGGDDFEDPQMMEK